MNFRGDGHGRFALEAVSPSSLANSLLIVKKIVVSAAPNTIASKGEDDEKGPKHLQRAINDLFSFCVSYEHSLSTIHQDPLVSKILLVIRFINLYCDNLKESHL
mmetsp:Transcript_27051/g.38341  ORF Transcript_27051/g.38341 Transcript_27051/m.38341 type:complete len:104 (+) Transcript_27051:1180-1491(+)